MMQDKASITAQSRPEPYDLLFKVVTIGDSNSGKTSLIHRYINGMPLETDSNKPTVGIEFSSKNLVKVSDFGLSRALGVGKDYYQTNFNANLKLPIAW